MVDVEIMWIDKCNNIRHFKTEIAYPINNWHAIQKAVDELYRTLNSEVWEIESIDVIGY